MGGKKSKLARKSGEEKSRTLRPEDGMHRLAKTVEREGNRLLSYKIILVNEMILNVLIFKIISLII